MLMIDFDFISCLHWRLERERVRSVSKQFLVEASIVIPDLSLDVGKQQRVHGRYCSALRERESCLKTRLLDIK